FAETPRNPHAGDIFRFAGTPGNPQYSNFEFGHDDRQGGGETHDIGTHVDTCSCPLSQQQHHQYSSCLVPLEFL
ncbi:hypothetical protein JMJ78_0010822, partial [Colletotrichum scovillei]